MSYSNKFMKEYISQENKDSLEKELEHLTTIKRKEVIEAVEYAKSLGDLSENAEYHTAREEQAKLQDRINAIEYILKNAVVTTPSTDGSINIGSHVVIKKEDEINNRKFTIVGSEEADMLSGKISYKSPLGQSLYGKRKGDRVMVATPKGEVNYEIVSVD